MVIITHKNGEKNDSMCKMTKNDREWQTGICRWKEGNDIISVTNGGRKWRDSWEKEKNEL